MNPRLRPSADLCLQHPFFHKRNLSNRNPVVLEPKHNAFGHSSSSSNLMPLYKPQVVQKNEGLKKIGANLILNNAPRNKY